MEDAFEVGRQISVEFADGEVGDFVVMADDVRGLLARSVRTNAQLFIPWDNIAAVVFTEDDDDPQP